LEHYKDPLKKVKEGIAWGLAVKGKYANSWCKYNFKILIKRW
jgi:hypothetical protein